MRSSALIGENYVGFDCKDFYRACGAVGRPVRCLGICNGLQVWVGPSSPQIQLFPGAFALRGSRLG